MKCPFSAILHILILVCGCGLQMGSQAETVPFGPVVVDDGGMADDLDGAEDRGPSPKKRGLPADVSSPQVPLTLEMLQTLLSAQTRELRDAQKLDLARSLGKVQLELRKDLENIRGEVGQLSGTLREQGEKIQEVENNQASILKRLQKLEADGSRAGSAASTSSGDASKLGLVVGGWSSVTKREDVLAQVAKISDKLGVRDELDGDWFCTGVRRGFALNNGVVREGENLERARKRLQGIAAAIQEAKICPQCDDPASRYVWAGLQKARLERDRSGHLGKMRKLLHQKSPAAISLFDWEYRTGTAYFQNKIVASAALPKPCDRTVIEGKMAGSWVDAIIFAKAAGLDPDAVVVDLRHMYDN